MSRNGISDFKLVSTSGLVFSQLCSDYSAGDSKEIQEVIDDRLLKQYRINKEKSSELIKKDITVINKRGSVLIDYAFCKGLYFPTCLDILYSQLGESYCADTMFENLTFSELSLANSIFTDLSYSYLTKLEYMKSSVAKEEKEKIKSLADYFVDISSLSQAAFNDRIGELDSVNSAVGAHGDPRDFKIGISMVGDQEASMIVSKDSFFYNDIELRSGNDGRVIDYDIAAIEKYEPTQYIYHRHTK